MQYNSFNNFHVTYGIQKMRELHRNNMVIAKWSFYKMGKRLLSTLQIKSKVKGIWNVF